ncbi:MAG TPA: adenylyl-sulfate kinase [Bacillales bacterium]|nr:adenylyl-sulfate kinase [Bacillales bacterium]
MASKATNITWHDAKVTKERRQQMNGHSSAVLWFTGLSGAGKSTLSVEVEKRLSERGIHTYVLDGDNIRHGLNKNLGFTAEDRRENIRRIGEVAKLFVDAGVVVLTAFISPYQEDRNAVRDMLDEDEFIEVYVNCSVEECERRDPKGLYQKARSGEIANFTGISAPYEAPEDPELTVETDQQSLEESAEQVIRFLEDQGYVKKSTDA